MSGRLAHELTRRIAAGNAHDPAAGMATRPTQVQATDRGAILGGARHRADDEELIERQLGVMPMSAADAKLALDIRRAQEPGSLDAGAQPRRAALERIDD